MNHRAVLRRALAGSAAAYMLVLAAYMGYLGTFGEAKHYVFAGAFVFWSGYFVVREIRISKHDARIRELEAGIAEREANA